MLTTTTIIRRFGDAKISVRIRCGEKAALPAARRIGPVLPAPCERRALPRHRRPSRHPRRLRAHHRSGPSPARPHQDAQGGDPMNQLVPVQDRREPGVNDTLTLAKVMADSGFFADARDAAQAVVKILAGKELGFGPVTSM